MNASESSSAASPLRDDVDYPKPPSVHWALAVVFHILTFGIFTVVLLVRQALWVRRIDPDSKALLAVLLALSLSIAAVVADLALSLDVLSLSLNMAAAVTFFWSFFSMRGSIEGRFGLGLSGPMTFFFTVYYLQYHLRRIARGEHSPEWGPVSLSAVR